MFRKIIIVLCLIVAGNFCSAQTLPAGPGMGGSPLYMKLDVKYMGTMTASEADIIKDYLNEFNAEKIMSADYSLTTNTFTIYHTAKLNETELLAIFRTNNYEAYFIRSGQVHRLNGTASGLVVTTYYPPED